MQPIDKTKQKAARAISWEDKKMQIEEQILNELARPHGHVCEQFNIVRDAMKSIARYGERNSYSKDQIKGVQVRVLWQAIDQRPDMKGYYLSSLREVGAAESRPLLYEIVDELAQALEGSKVVPSRYVWEACSALDILARSPDLDKERVLPALRRIQHCVEEGRKYRCHVYRMCGNWEEVNDLKDSNDLKWSMEKYRELL